MSACCEAGAIMGDTKGEKYKALVDFGYHFGICYQLVDDVIDNDAVYMEKDHMIRKALDHGNRSMQAFNLFPKNSLISSLSGLTDFILCKAETLKKDLSKIIADHRRHLLSLPGFHKAQAEYALGRSLVQNK